jgi:hypothetical protein
MAHHHADHDDKLTAVFALMSWQWIGAGDIDGLVLDVATAAHEAPTG